MSIYISIAEKRITLRFRVRKFRKTVDQPKATSFIKSDRPWNRNTGTNFKWLPFSGYHFFLAKFNNISFCEWLVYVPVIKAPRVSLLPLQRLWFYSRFLFLFWYLTSVSQRCQLLHVKQTAGMLEQIKKIFFIYMDLSFDYLGPI